MRATSRADVHQTEDTVTPHSFPAPARDAAVATERPAYLSTHRALAASTREFGRLTEALESGVAALHSAGIDAAPVVRRTPARCILQLGPVALTAAWLQNPMASVAEGELMVIVWEGAVGARREHRPEQLGTRPAPPPATVLWEAVYVAAGETEAEWRWQPGNADGAPLTSPELAAQCVERLRRAHEVHAGAPV